jgi:multiple sugar transport system substrate-binding protein
MVDFKKLVPAVVSAGLLLLSGTLAFAAGGEEASADEGLSGEMSIHLGSYTPGVVRGEGLEKLVEAQEIVDEYQQLHPGVSIEILTDPVSGLEWVVTQLSGGTAPDILSVKNEWAYQYKDNNWFVDLMPYMQEPNPYVPGNAVAETTCHAAPVRGSLHVDFGKDMRQLPTLHQLLLTLLGLPAWVAVCSAGDRM